MQTDDSISLGGSARPDVLIIAPSFHETSGGAAIYYRMLVRLLGESGVAVEVVSDSGGVELGEGYHPLFPRRCDIAGRGWRNRVAYAAQNAAYLRLPRLVADRQPGTILFHSSFLNLPGVFPFVLRRVHSVARARGTRIIADVRDRLLPQSAVGNMQTVDAVIACSEGVQSHLVRLGVASERIHRIPVIQQHLSFAPDDVAKTLASHGLDAVRYILYVGLVKEEKGIDILLQSYLRYVRPRVPTLRLVICGQLKTARRDILSGLREPGVQYLGPISQKDALRLTAGARLNACVSRSEGLSRACLESLALERPTLLPRHVPEFSRYCSEFVPESYEPARVAEKLMEIYESAAVPSYPVAEHAPEAVRDAYMRLLMRP